MVLLIVNEIEEYWIYNDLKKPKVNCNYNSKNIWFSSFFFFEIK